MNKRLHSFFKVILLMALLHTGLDMSGQTAYDKLYWNGYNPLDIESINLDGTGRTMLFPSTNAAFSLEVDVANQKMYWCDLNQDAIMQSNLDGTNASVFLANVIDAQGISMDFANHVLYFTSTNTSTIEKVNLDGTGRTVVVGPSNAGQPESLKVDSSHQKLYWFDHNAYSIKRCNMDGTGVEVFVSSSGNALQLDIDEANSKLYWPNWGMNILESINLDGTSRTTILSGFVNVGWPLALAVDKVNNKIYWWDADMYYIKRVNTDGTGFEVFLNDIYSVAAMIIPAAQPTSISSNPSAISICAGGNTSFSITASNATGYQWQVYSGSGFADISDGGAYSGATTATLTITEATSEMNGSTYRCIASANSFPDATSESASLTVSENITYYEDFDGDGYGNGSVTTDSCTGAPEGFVSNFDDCDDNDLTTYPGAVEICDDGADNNCDGNVDECDLAIITHPAHEVTICLGEDASFSVTAFGMPFYRWQVNDGFGYTDINDGELYTGAFTATLIINTPSMEMNGYVYRCIVYGNDDTATSDPGELFIKTEMVFTGQPYSAQWCLGEVATYTCFATSATNYQWQVNEGAGFIDLEDEDVSEGGHYSDVHNRELSIYNLTTAMEGFTYRCIASNECAADATSNYAALTILDSENAVYYEDADGDGYGNPDSSISYCYLPEGYVLNADDCNDYDSTVYPGAEEICGDGIDNNCDGNDEACPIVYHPQRTTTICLGESATLWITANSGLTYQWQLFNGLGYTDIDNGGLYSGTDTAALTIINPSEEISGQAYRCAISGIEDGIPFESFTDPGVLYVRAEMIIMSQPQSYEACPQEEVRFYSYATSGAYFQWQVNDGSGFTNLENGDAPSGGSYTGVDTNEMYVNNLTLDMTGYTYRCIISNGCFPEVTSDAAELIVIQSQDNIVYYEDIDGDGYGNPDTAFAYCYLLEDMEGYVFNGDDCNDYDPSVYPGSGAEEICGDGIDNDCDGNTDEDCEFCPTTTVWNGSDWFPTAPSIESKVVFMADYTSTDILPACSVEVMDNVTVTIASGHTLAVWTKVEVHPLGQLIFNNNASLIQHPEITVNENTGSITFHKDSNALYNLDYTIWSSPTSGTQTLKDFSTGTLDANFFVYNTALSAYSNYLSQSGIFGSNPNAVTFTSGKGYLVRMPAGLPAAATSVFNGVFEGTPNNGDISIALSNEGGRFNAVGNPYPSPISIRDFIDANEEQMDNGTLYFWRKTNLAPTATYVTVTNMGSAAVDQPTDSSGSFTGDPSDWVIQPGQGFLFKASTTANELIFNNFMRRPSTIGPFFRPAVTTMDDTNELSRIWLDISNSSTSFGQAVIGYSANTTNGLDFGWDGRLYNDSDLSIYTKADDAKLAIQARAAFTAEDAVPLSYKANNAGTFTLKMSNYDGLFAGSQQVYLKDNVFNIYHDLKAGDYTFSSEEGTFENRFEVVYMNAALGTDSPAFDANNVIVYKEANTLKIDAGKVSMQQVDIFDIRGRLLYSVTDVNATTLAINNLSVAQQVLIVQITSEDNSRTSKKIIY